MSTLMVPERNAPMDMRANASTASRTDVSHCTRCGKELPGKKAYKCYQCQRDLDIIASAMWGRL
jgi:hypothetical protein